MALLPNYKEIVELIKKGSTVEAQEKILELREGALALQEENITLREQVKALENQLKIKAEIVWKKPLYWKVSGDNKDGPYCQKCYDTEEKLIQLQSIDEGSWHCKVCNNVYYEDSYNPSENSFGITTRSSSQWDDY